MPSTSPQASHTHCEHLRRSLVRQRFNTPQEFRTLYYLHSTRETHPSVGSSPQGHLLTRFFLQQSRTRRRLIILPVSVLAHSACEKEGSVVGDDNATPILVIVEVYDHRLFRVDFYPLSWGPSIYGGPMKSCGNAFGPCTWANRPRSFQLNLPAESTEIYLLYASKSTSGRQSQMNYLIVDTGAATTMRCGNLSEANRKIIVLPGLAILAPPRVYALCLGTGGTALFTALSTSHQYRYRKRPKVIDNFDVRNFYINIEDCTETSVRIDNGRAMLWPTCCCTRMGGPE
ncbi:hypothetical protein EVAR_25400_1 [Eumeta japonica]|uniref:Uncharacterized protein n=1 Tax=Eumeta variegata TaxID=151549 RepID=A0A4C1V5D0_EUMVA|nr:hypothetical protein EVAR_25400_1 [Eumeta japonica]